MRTVAVTIEPVPYSLAMRRAEAAQTAEVAEEINRSRQGFVSTARIRRRQQAASRREEELADGHAEMRWVGYVRTSARSIGGARARPESRSSTPPSSPASACSASTASRTPASPSPCRSAGGCGEAAARRAPRPLRHHRPLPGRLPLPRPRAASAPPAPTSAATPTAAPGSMTLGRSIRARPAGAEHADPRRPRLAQVDRWSRPTSTARRSSAARPGCSTPRASTAPLARALGVQPITLAPGGEVRLNPLSPRGGREGQLSLLRSVAQAALRRELEPRGGRRPAGRARGRRRGMRAAASRRCRWSSTRCCTPARRWCRASRRRAREDFAEANRASALALQRLCEGDLRGMFDGPTSEGLDLDAPLVVLDLSAVRDSAALGILMTCAAAWQQAILLERKRAAEREGGRGAEADLGHRGGLAGDQPHRRRRVAAGRASSSAARSACRTSSSSTASPTSAPPARRARARRGSPRG